MDRVLKVGIVGCGAIGKDHCRRIIDKVPGATVVAVSDYVAAAADELAAKYGLFPENRSKYSRGRTLV